MVWFGIHLICHISVLRVSWYDHIYICLLYYIFAGSTFAKILRKEGLLKTLDRCCLASESSLHLTRWAVKNPSHSPIYAALLLKIHIQHMYFPFSNVMHLFLSFSSNSMKWSNAGKFAQKPTKKVSGRIWPNWIFSRWECSWITSTTGQYRFLFNELYLEHIVFVHVLRQSVGHKQSS